MKALKDLLNMLKVIKISIKKLYLMIFARAFFQKINYKLLLLNLNSLGILNYETGKLSGEDNFVKKYLKSLHNPIIFDVGANIGNYSLLIKLVNPNSTIYAFEPSPTTFSKLEKNLAEHRVICINMGLGSSVTQMELFDYKEVDSSSHASLYSGVFDDLRKTEKNSTLVDITTLNQFCKDNHLEKIDFLKIDTEGNELEVLKGASELLQAGKIAIIQFEFNEMNIYSRVLFKDFIDLLTDYKLYRLLPNGLIPLQPYSPLFNEIFAYQNIIAFHKNINLQEQF